MIRRAEKTDMPTIRAMAEVAFRHTYREILSPEQMEYMMEWMYSAESLERQLHEGHVYGILNREGKDVGYVSYNRERLEDDEVVFHLQKIYLLPEWHGVGLGARLLKWAEERMRDEVKVLQAREAEKEALKAREMKVEALQAQETEKGALKARYELNVNRQNGAVGFYEHMGLEILRTGDFAIGEGFFMNDYIMGKMIMEMKNE